MTKEQVDLAMSALCAAMASVLAPLPKSATDATCSYIREQVKQRRKKVAN